MCGLTSCAAHVQWPLRSLGRACCCMMAPEMSVTENEDKELGMKGVTFQKASMFDAQTYFTELLH